MLKGIRLQAHPTIHQKNTLSQWMGCARYIWNAKTYEEKEQRLILSKQKIYPKIDQSYAHFKDKKERPWLFQTPSVILRNSIANWYTTYQNFFKKRCGRPTYKKKDGRGSVHLTRELFEFKKGKDGVTRLFIGSKRNNIGFLSIKNHRSYKKPNSIYIKKKHNKYWVSFCFEDGSICQNSLSDKLYLSELRKKGKDYLEAHTIGIDRGVARPVQSSASDTFFDFSEGEKKNKKKLCNQVRRFQKKLSRQKKGSNRRHKTKVRLSNRHGSIANIRENFCHQTSRKIVDREKTEVIVFENLRTKCMTKKPKAKQDENGKWLRNNASAKAGLNKSILDKSWHLLEVFTKYKAKNEGKIVFKVSPNYTSQECAHCHHIHPKNRKSQDIFLCLSCGHTGNADINAAGVIKQRAIKFILNSGTELSKSGVLSLGDSGRGDKVRRKGSSENLRSVDEALKKKVASATGSSMALEYYDTTKFFL